MTEEIPVKKEVFAAAPGKQRTDLPKPGQLLQLDFRRSEPSTGDATADPAGDASDAASRPPESIRLLQACWVCSRALGNLNGVNHLLFEKSKTDRGLLSNSSCNTRPSVPAVEH